MRRLLVLLTALGAPATGAAQPDTLAAYFPLTVGNRWDFEGRDSEGVYQSHVRWTVVSDSAAGDGRVAELRVAHYLPGSTVPSGIPCILTYIFLTTPEPSSAGYYDHDCVGFPMTAPLLSPPFWNWPGGGNGPVQVGDSTYTTRVTFAGDSYTMGGFGGASSWVFAWQIGPLFVFNCTLSHTTCSGGNEWTLVYAEVDGAIYGAPPLPVASEPQPGGSTLTLRVLPNPARGRVALEIGLPASLTVRVDVFDALGRRVVAGSPTQLQTGPHRLPLDTSALRPGIYFVRLVSGGSQVSRPLAIE